MASLLHQLENNEAILLMYLADELPPEDRAEVEQMLSRDQRLRSELERLQRINQTVEEGLGMLDEAFPVSRQERALRRVSRIVRQWAVDRLRPQEEPEEVVSRRFPLWGYPIAGAAMVAILLAIWWQVLPKGGVPPPVLVERPVSPEIDILAESFATDVFAENYKPFEDIERELTLLRETRIDF